MGDYAAALPLHRQALEVFRTALGENHNSSGRFRGWLKALPYQAWRDLTAERRRAGGGAATVAWWSSRGVSRPATTWSSSSMRSSAGR